jgi:hypothetical protein
MSVFAGFGQGFNEQRETNQRKRVEVAKAFEEFKRNNPYATVQDYQQYIDGIAGGSNYLRGGMPSGEVLESLAKRNLEQKQLDDLNNHLSLLQNQAQTQGALQAQIDNAVLNSDGDFGGAADTFLQGLPGIESNNALKTSIMGNFNQPYYDDLIRQRVIKNMPSAIQYLEAAEDPTAITDQEIADNLGVSLDIAKGLRTGAMTRYTRAQDALKIEKEGLLLDLAGSSLADGMRGTELAPLLQQRARTLGISPDAKYINSLVARAERDYTRAEENRNMELEGAARRASGQIIDGFRDRDANLALIRRGDVDSWKTDLLDQLKDRMSDREFKLQFGVEKDAASISLVDPYYEAELERQRLIQNETQQKSREKSAEALRTYSSEYITKNAERAENGIGQMGEMGKVVGNYLAQRYDMNSSANIAAINVFEAVLSRNEDATIQEIVTAIQNDPTFQSAAPSVADAQQAYAGNLAQLNSTFDVDTFENYITNVETATQTDLTAMNENFSALMNVEDPQQRIAALNALKSGVQNWAEQTTVMHTARQQRQDRWVEYGTGGWDQSRSDTYTNSLMQNSQQMIAKIDDAIAEAEAQAADGVGNALDGSLPDFFSYNLQALGPDNMNLPTESYEDRVKYLNTLAGSMRQGSRSSRNSRVTNEEGYHYSQMLDAFLGNEGGVFSSSSGVREAIASDPDKFAQFLQNPYAYMINDPEFLQLNPIFDPQNPDNPYGVGGR